MLTALDPAGAPAEQQMLYTFASAGTAAQVGADLASVKAALPPGAAASWVSWVSSDRLIAGAQGINTPFVVAFAVIALVLAVLITASVACRRSRQLPADRCAQERQVLPPGCITYLTQIGVPP